VEKHGGNLKCHSAPGQGTEFAIEIPVRKEEGRRKKEEG
jgi:two-component system, NtrC family, sensor kinase